MPDIGTAVVDINTKVHKVKYNTVARAFGKNGSNWCFIDSCNIGIADFAPVYDPRNVFVRNTVIPFKDTNVGLRDS
jgi:hypothetical protein